MTTNGVDSEQPDEDLATDSFTSFINRQPALILRKQMLPSVIYIDIWCTARVLLPF